MICNWSSVINTLTGGADVTVDPARWDLSNPEYYKILKSWQEANFNLEAVKWTNYYPGLDFSKDIVDQVANELGLKHVHRAWISKIDPGYCAPWHWDVDEDEATYLEHGPIKRYTVVIRKMANCHILVIGTDYYYNKDEGTIIKWGNYNEWHSGINAGMEPSYLFHILGS